VLDPISIGLAFSAAQAAVSGIKQAIALGKDIQEITHDLGSFFKHSGEVKQAAAIAQELADDPKSTEDVTMLALDIVLKEKKLRDDEAALKHLIIYELDQSDVWFEMERIRDSILAKRKTVDEEKLKAQTEAHLAKNRLLAKKRREKEALLNLVQTIFTIVLTVVIVGGGITYTLYWLIKNYS